MSYCMEKGVSESASIERIADYLGVQDDAAQNVYCKVKSASGSVVDNIRTLIDDPSYENLKKYGRTIGEGIGLFGSLYSGALFLQGGALAGAVAKLAVISGTSLAVAQLMSFAIFAVVVYCFIHFTWPRIVEFMDSVFKNIQSEFDKF